tara:strand:- start:76356 stop:77222 length:867 start_codon:yes stop_codon:yes gene_type:complete
MQSEFYLKYKKNIDSFINNAINEDIGEGDFSSLSSITKNKINSLELISNEDCTIAGLSLVRLIIRKFNKNIKFISNCKDGQKIKKNSKILIITGPIIDILSIERLILNCLQRMSGVATLTNNLVNKVSHTNCKILDTRKTTPNFRYPEKWAVKIGGAFNHRMDLSDEIMIKDNHIDFSKSLSCAMNNVFSFKKKYRKEILVVVEVRNYDEIYECLNFKWIDRLLLDNMSIEEINKSIKLISGIFKTEASGNINENNIKEIADTGVDYISIGALTHSYKNIDLSFRVQK